MSDTITKFEELARQAKLEEIRMEEWRANEEAIERRKRIIDQNGNSGIHYLSSSCTEDNTRVFYGGMHQPLVDEETDYPESNVETSDLDITSSSNTATLTNTDSTDTFLGRTFSDGIPNFNGFIYDEELEGCFTNPVELEGDKAPDFKTVTDSIADLLKYKNLKYGNAALEPMEIFEGKTKVGQRLDDKLARVKNGEDLKKNDIADLIGYLTLVCVENGWDNFDEFKD